MKTYLPHYFKRIGVLFVLIAIAFSICGGIDDIRQGFTEGYRAARSNNEITNQTKILVEPYLSDDIKNTFTWISLIFSISGFLIYLFSKEKIDDEYIQQLRLKSILQAFLVSWIVYAISKYIIQIIPMDGIYILQMQLIVYVIIFKYNKDKEISEEEIALED